MVGYTRVAARVEKRTFSAITSWKGRDEKRTEEERDLESGREPNPKDINKSSSGEKRGVWRGRLDGAQDIEES
jgi:hypothetical protein